MPFVNVAQRRALWAKAPAVAQRWSDEYGAKPGGGFTANQKAERGLPPSASNAKTKATKKLVGALRNRG